MPPDLTLTAKLKTLLSLVNDDGQPNLNALTAAVRNIELSNLSIKAFGYDLARQLVAALPPIGETAAQHVGLRSKASVQADIESAWTAHWVSELQVPMVYHRKLWELAYVLQAVHEEGHLRPGARGLGFGCGVEPLPSYFAANGMRVTVTDLPAGDAQQRGWADTNQHATSLEQAFHPHLVDRAAFDANVNLRYVDMNAIPRDLDGFDFCWSVCALEHLGTIDRGLDFIESALATLRPGGLAVHTTEYNINPEGPTIDNWPTVLFQRRHMEALAERLAAKGHWMAPLDFDLGGGPMDRFIDLPPFSHDLPAAINDWIGSQHHLKLAVDGFAATCFGIVVRKG